MKRFIVILAAVMFIFALAVTATADVDVHGKVNKDKDVTVTEKIKIDKDIKINVDLNAEAEKAGEADAVLNQSNMFNYACENCAEKAAGLVGSIIDNTGIVGTNQAIGNMNNQANVVTIAVDTVNGNGDGNGNGGETIGFANAQTAAGQKMIANRFVTQGIYLRDSLIAGSINENKGIVGVNQSAGNMNNQGNMVALAVSLVPGVALSEADLGQTNICNSVNEFNTIKSVEVLGSVNANKGIVGVNQTSGNGANQLNGVSISATIR